MVGVVSAAARQTLANGSANQSSALQVSFCLEDLREMKDGFHNFSNLRLEFLFFLPPLPCSARAGAKFLAAGEKFGEMYGNFS